MASETVALLLLHPLSHNCQALPSSEFRNLIPESSSSKKGSFRGSVTQAYFAIPLDRTKHQNLNLEQEIKFLKLFGRNLKVVERPSA